jgi:hypothetical protein
MKRVIVHIDRLVLKGYAAGERDELAAALGAELGRLLADPTTVQQLSGLGHAARIRVNLQSPTGEAGPEHPGAAAAKAIVGGLTR